MPPGSSISRWYQIEINPFLYRKNTIQFFKAEGVVMHGYRALRTGKEMQNPTVLAVAGKHGKTVAQVLGRWCVQQEIVYIPKSENKGRMVENAAVFDFELDSDDMDKLGGLTSAENIADFVKLYKKCVVRDCPLQKTNEGVKESITMD